jgi:Flp pilus assembly pilin Flp
MCGELARVKRSLSMKGCSAGRRHDRGQGTVEYALIIALVVVVVIATLILLRPQIAPIFQNISMNLDSYVDLPDLHLSIQTAPEVHVNHPFTVTASIASPQPLTSLVGIGQNVALAAPYPAESLGDILRPPAAYTGSYSLCLMVDLRLDDDSAFDLGRYSTPWNTEQEFTLVPGVTTTQTAQWTVSPRDTFGVETVPHQARIRVWFDAETTCRLGTPSLLGDSFFLSSSSPYVEQPARFTVVNDDLRQQRALTAHLQPLAVAAVSAGTTASVGWAAGVFGWVLRPRSARRKHGASKQVPPRRAATRSRFKFVGLGGALLSIGVVLITLGPSTLAYALGTDATLGSFCGGMVVACVGIAVLASGVRRIRFAYSA